MKKEFNISNNGLKNLYKNLRNNKTISSKKWRKKIKLSGEVVVNEN